MIADIDDRERDRNAEAALEHLIEEAVARVVEVVLIAGEALLLEQEAVQGRDLLEWLGIRRHPRSRRLREGIEFPEPVLYGHLRLKQPGDAQGRPGQVDRVIGQFGERGQVFDAGLHARPPGAGLLDGHCPV